jgi:hypothetical protein
MRVDHVPCFSDELAAAGIIDLIDPAGAATLKAIEDVLADPKAPRTRDLR